MVQVGPEPVLGEATPGRRRPARGGAFLPESSSDLVHPVASARLVTRRGEEVVRGATDKCGGLHAVPNGAAPGA